MPKKAKQPQKKSQPKYRCARVKWLDTTSLDAWLKIEDAVLLTPLPCSTRGCIIKDTEDSVIIALTLGGEEPDRCFGTTRIPRGMILEVLYED